MAHEVSRSGERSGGVDADRGNERKLRFVRLVFVGSTGLVVLPLVFFSLVDAAASDSGLRHLILTLGLALVAGTMLLVLFLDRVRLERRPRTNPWLYWGSYSLTVVLAALLHDPWVTLLTIVCWWGSCAFVGPRRWGVWATISLVPLALLFIATLDRGYPVSVYFLLAVGPALTGLFFAAGTLTYIRLWDITNEALLNQRARSRLAVSEERLRFARDMHDLLGHSLSALVVKSELAERLLPRDASRAAAEMTEVQELARKSLQQVRSAVRGYRKMDLPEEVDAVRGVLEANGVRVEVLGLEGLEIPPETAAMVAWVVREGATNVLRHSNASVCRIGFTPTEESIPGATALVVEMSNDRARGGRSGSGSGLAGLSERLSGAGGSLTARMTGSDGFLLRAVLPYVSGRSLTPDAPPLDEEAR